MGTLSIPRKNIDRIELYGGKTRQTAQQVLNSLTDKPDYIINAMMYDTASGWTVADTIVDGVWVNGGNYTPKGIAFNNAMDMIECESSYARDKDYEYFMGGSPNLLWNGALNIDRTNGHGTQRFTKYETDIATAIRLGFGFTDKDIIVYYPPHRVTMKHVGEYLLKMGCKAAINLDGGGSTKVCKVVDGKLQNLNTPTENRPNTTWILIYMKKDIGPSTPVKTESTKSESNTVTNTQNTTTTTGGSKMAYSVMLDPGHGGTDPGAVGKVMKLQEDDVALKIAFKVKAHLERCGIHVQMTRTTDTLVPINTRCQLANKATVKVNKFVSIHCNSAANTSAVGIESFAYSVNGAGYKLATAIQNKLISATGETNRGVKTNTSLGVLSGTSMAAALIECGFISNAETEAKLATGDYQEVLAQAIAEGICENLKVAWVPYEKYDTSDWKVAAMKRICEDYGLDMDAWFAKKDENITVGEMFGILNKLLLQLEK